MDSSQTLMMIFYAIAGIFLLGTILSGFFQVKTAEAVIIQRMGKFQHVATAGMNFKLPWLDQIAAARCSVHDDARLAFQQRRQGAKPG